MAGISQAFRCFDAVARRGSVRKAAATLHLTAAAVHQQILNFESQVGTPLFDRLPRGMQLTAAGEIVLASVRRSQRDYEQARWMLRGGMHWARSILAEDDAREASVPGGSAASSALTLLRAARQVAELHGGRMSVDCRDGMTTLSIAIPTSR